MSRDEIIKYLTKQELEWLVENPTEVEEVAIFFANGGFERHTDEELQNLFKLRAEGYD